MTRVGVLPDRSFWRGRSVLLSGHTGFKGAWLAIWLGRLGARVTGIALPPASDAPSLYALAGVDADVCSHFCDIGDAAALRSLVADAKPEIVFHLAAQAQVREGYRQPLATLATNVMGSAHLLDALRGLDGVRVAVLVTTDKVYENRGALWPFRESDPLGGHDPYSASKAACEIVAASYRAAFLSEAGVAVATARAGNVIGGGDWATDRLIPDAVRAWQGGYALRLRRAEAIRPWQHVLEPLAGYLLLAQRLWSEPRLADAYNFGPRTDEAASVAEVIELARQAYGGGEVEYASQPEGPHEAGHLTLETARAAHALGVRPRWSLLEAVQRTMAWYRALGDGGHARELCLADLLAYEGAACRT